MIIRTMITKTYRIVRNWSDTLNRGKMIAREAKTLHENSKELIQDIKNDWLDRQDIQKLQQGSQKLRTDGEKIMDEVTMIGEKIKDEV